MEILCKFLFILLTGTLMLFSCVKEPSGPDTHDPVTGNITRGIYVLNEGLFNMNNSTVTYYNFADSSAVTDYFELQNERKLGDTGNDIAIYGGKMYIIVNVSSQLEVVDPYTGQSVRQVPFFNGDKPRQPRHIAFHEGRAFVCSFDGTVAVIDTATLETEKFITVGRNPDGIAVANNKVYVTNSGGMDYPHYDNTVSVIDINTLTEIKKIELGINPYAIVPDKYGDLYVISRGNYGEIKSSLQIIDSYTDEVKYTFPGLEALNLTVSGDSSYVYYYDFMGSAGSRIMLMNVYDETVIRDNFIADGTIIETAYGIAVDSQSGDIFVSDAKGFVRTGEVVCFSRDGEKKYSFKAGLNPGHLVLVK